MSAAHSMLGKTLRGYKLVSLLGEGGMGTVFRAEHPMIGKTVAIKLLRSEFCTIESQVERFLWEAKAVNEISHENIIDIIDFAYDDGSRPYLVMEFIDGKSLDDVIDTETAFSLERVAHIALQICSALSATHEKGIIHRDLKSENIYLLHKIGRPDFVKILDFGIAKILGGQPKLAQTNAGAILGTPGYMAPEQFRGTYVDARTDIYALGVILFEMLTKRLPFEEEGIVELFDRQQREEAPSAKTFRTDLPESWEKLVARCLARDAKDRFHSMRELAEAIASCCSLKLTSYVLSSTLSEWNALEESRETTKMAPLEEQEQLLEEVAPSGESFAIDSSEFSQITIRIPKDTNTEITLPPRQKRKTPSEKPLSLQPIVPTPETPAQPLVEESSNTSPTALSPEIENWFLLSKKLSSVSDTAELLREKPAPDDAVPISDLAVTAYTNAISSMETRPLSTVDLSSMETRQLMPSDLQQMMSAETVLRAVENPVAVQSKRSWYLSLAVCLALGVVIGLVLFHRKPVMMMEDVSEVPVIAYVPPQTEQPPSSPSEAQTPKTLPAVAQSAKKKTASLIVGANISCECFLNGENLGFTPCISKELQPGNYAVLLKNSAFGIEEQFSVTLAAGDDKKIRKQFSLVR